MKVFQKKIDKGKKLEYIDVIPEINDDIFTLHNIIDTDDLVEATTSRKVEVRPNNHKRIPMRLCIKTETTHADIENGFFHIKGKVMVGNEYVSVGQYHTIEIGLLEKLRVFKTEITYLLKQSLKKETDILLFLIVKKKEIVFFEMSDNFAGVKFRIGYKGKIFKDAVNQCNLKNYKMVIIVGENNIYELQKALFVIKENITHKSKVISIRYNEIDQCPKKISNSILTDPNHVKLFNDVQFIKEFKAFSLFLELRTTSELTVVGYEEVNEAVEMGALKNFFITNTKLKSFDTSERKCIEDLCRRIECMKIPINILPSRHEKGEELDKMGGLVGVLKFAYKD